jgi:hypothetical protein
LSAVLAKSDGQNGQHHSKIGKVSCCLNNFFRTAIGQTINSAALLGNNISNQSGHDIDDNHLQEMMALSGV